MKADLSRLTFAPLKQYTSVVMQQGRVQLDADWNEQTSIVMHYMRALAADMIGQHGGPDDVFSDQTGRKGLTKRNCGYAIIGAALTDTGATTFFPSETVLTADEMERLKKLIGDRDVLLLITPGHYYADGLLAENETYWRYSKQPYLQQPNDDALTKLPKGNYLLYLDVWERTITPIDDPSIREVALGGADTAVRTKLIWQVKAWPDALTGPVDCKTFKFPPKMQEFLAANRGTLRVKAKELDPGDPADPCTTSPEARFRGVENRLYRVEIHRGSPNPDTDQDNPATFKWSRDNGMIVAALVKREGDNLIVSGLRDLSRWFRAGDWTEITHEALDLTSQPGTMVRLIKVEGETLTIDPKSTEGTIFEPAPEITNVKVRRWDQREGGDALKGGAIPIEKGVWIELEDGVAVWFDFPSQGNDRAEYRSGDYWLIPARVATGDVEWPSESVPDPDHPGGVIIQPAAVPPDGIDHHYAPLAAVSIDGLKIIDPPGITDLRHKFGPLGECR